MMKLLSPDKSALMEVQTIERDGNELVIKGKVFGTMPIVARLTPEETRKGFRLLNARLIWFLLTLPFRRSER